MEQYSNLAQKLIDQRLVSDNEMERVVRLQQEQQAPLTRLIVEMGLLSEDDLLPVLRDHYALPLISLKDQPTNPLELSRLHALEVATGLRVKPVLAKDKDITLRIEALFGNGSASDSAQPAVAREIEGAVDDEDVAHLRDMASEVPVIRMVNQMLVRALESRASDVHIEPFENQLKIRYRIDGILHEVESPPRQLKGAVI